MPEQVEIFRNAELGLQVRMINNPDGSISISAEDAAIGFGWCKTEKKNGKEYTSIRWERMNNFSAECGFTHEWSKDDYIPEPLFYRLGMKASNPAADKFQNWLAFEVIPSIRKHGAYATEQTIDKIIEDPDFGIELLTKLKEERAARIEVEKKNEILNNENDLLAQKALQWADRPLINSLVRAYAYAICGDFQGAWRDFKKELLYQHSINLNARITHYLNETGRKTKPKTLDMLDDSELQKALSTAVAMCRERDVDITDIISKKISLKEVMQYG